MTGAQAKIILRNKGWSYLRAAEALGYSFSHVAKSLTGARPISKIMRKRIYDLGMSKEPYRRSGFARKQNILNSQFSILNSMNNSDGTRKRNEKSGGAAREAARASILADIESEIAGLEFERESVVLAIKTSRAERKRGWVRNLYALAGRLQEIDSMVAFARWLQADEEVAG